MPDPGPPGLSWLVVDADSGEVLLSRSPDLVLRTASVAKVLVLGALARALETGEVREDEVLSRSVTPPVADSGLWHLMATESLPVLDVALLVGAVSDNWATNVLVARLGLEAVNAVGTVGTVGTVGLAHTRLHDLVRDVRGPADPPTLSTGTAREWVSVLVALHRGAWVSPAVSARVLGWLAAGTDHSLVSAAFGRDPLVVDPGLATKTGSDHDVRCEVGLVAGTARVAAYACLGNGDPDDLVGALRSLGARVRALTSG